MSPYSNQRVSVELVAFFFVHTVLDSEVTQQPAVWPGALVLSWGLSCMEKSLLPVFSSPQQL